MKMIFPALAVVALTSATATAAIVNTTIAVRGAGTSAAGTINAPGTVTFTGDFAGTGTFSSTFALTDPNVLTGKIPVTITVTTGSILGTMTGILTASPTLLLAVLTTTSSASGAGTIAITGGTGGLLGVTGSFTVTVAGAGSGTTGSGAGAFTIGGPGTLNLAGTTTITSPVVTGLLNNYSLVPPGFPNYGIAPGTLFVIQGTALADPTAQAVLQSSADPGIPTKLNGASVNVTVNGTTVKAGLYYAIATQIAAVLPAATPVGTGTVTVTYNNTPSATFAITVVAAAPGFGTYNGLAIATNPSTGSLYSYTNSIKPGDVIVLWGSGLGAIPADSDLIFTTSPHASTIPLKIFIGGIEAFVYYAGDSGYPGVNQIDVVVPQSVSPGCYVSLVAVSGSGTNLVTSNNTFIPVSATGGACSDPSFGTDGNSTITNSNKTNLNTGIVILGHVVLPTSATDFAQASFLKTTGASVLSTTKASLGSCNVTQTPANSVSSVVTGLAPGTVTVTSPAGTSATLASIGTGNYLASLATGFISTSGGTFTIQGTGGSDVGPFTATIAYPNPLLQWTNIATSATVTRSAGLPVTWTGGATGTYVEISGTSVSASGAKGSFNCYAPLAAGQFTVPSSILLSLPSGTGTMSVLDTTSSTPFTAAGLDTAFSFGFTQTQGNSTYN